MQIGVILTPNFSEIASTLRVKIVPTLEVSNVGKWKIRNHCQLTVKSLGNWGQGNNDAFEFELSFEPGELELDSKWKICWDNPYPPGLTFEDADKAGIHELLTLHPDR